MGVDSEPTLPSSLDEIHEKSMKLKLEKMRELGFLEESEETNDR